MDLLVLSHLVPYPTTSGVLLRCYNLLKETARAHRVYLYAMHQRVLLSASELERSVAHLETFCEEVRVFPIPSDSSRWRYAWLLARNLVREQAYSLERFYAHEIENAIVDLLGRRPIQLIQHETIAMAPYGALAPDLPQILVHQNVESKLLARRAQAHRDRMKRWYVGLQARKLEAAERRYLRSLGAHVAVSAADRDAFLSMEPGARVRVVVNGVDVDYFRPAPVPAGTGSGLLFVGGMSWYPNRDAIHWFLSDIWPRIHARCPDSTLTVVGSHPSAQVQKAAARDPDHVRAPGLVPDIRPWVDEAALIVCPFRVGGGTRLKILDAWSMQKAVLSTSLGAEGLDTAHDRELWIADDAEGFADAAVDLLGDAETRSRLGEAGRHRAVAEFAWPKVARGMLELYEELVAEHRGAAAHRA